MPQVAQVAVGPFASALAARREGGVEIIVLSAYGDESADGTKRRVFAVATVIGDDAAWRSAENAWLARTGGVIFHATDCEATFARDPDRSKHKANLELYADLTKIIAASNLFGYGAALDLAAFRECFTEAPDDAPYFICFIDVLRRTAERAAQLTQSIEYTFDRRQQSEYNAGALYGILVNRPEWKANIFMHTKVSFDCNRNPRIQIADLVAHETMKDLDNEIGSRKIPVRKSMLALRESGNFFFGKMGREYCAWWRDQMSEPDAGVGFTQKGYSDWLDSHRLNDNLANRFRHLEFLLNKSSLS